MAERQHISRDRIEQNLTGISHTQHMIRQIQLATEAEIGWFVASPGRFFGELSPVSDEVTISDNVYMTYRRLQGAKNKLASTTLVRALSMKLPADMSPEGVTAFIESRGLDNVRRLGSISLEEPGMPIFNPVKMKLNAIFESEAISVKLAAEGIDAYLNDPSVLITGDKADELNEHIKNVREKFTAQNERDWKSVSAKLLSNR